MHRQTLDHVYRYFDTSYEGLTTSKVKKAKSVYGSNNIPTPVVSTIWLCCIAPFVYSPEMKDYREIVPEYGNVKRNGQFTRIDATSLVPGDIIQIYEGERVPADIRIIEVYSLYSMVLIILLSFVDTDLFSGSISFIRFRCYRFGF